MRHKFQEGVMAYILSRRVLALLVLIVSAVALAPAARAQSCNEQCLIGVLHHYLAQLPKHDAGALPVAPDVQASENSMPVKLGEGSWKNVTAVLPGYEFADPVSHEVIYGGGVRRGDMLGILFLRLKVVGGRITESEMLTSGEGAVRPPAAPPAAATPAAATAAPVAAGAARPAQRPPPAPDLSGLMYPDVLYDAIVPVNRRSTRAQLAQVPLLYFEGLGKGDGSIPPFGPRCDRWAAGGRKLTNNPSARGGAISCATAVDGMQRMQGRSTLNRRIVVVDVPHGIAVGMVIVAFTAGGRQFAQDAAEIFKVVDGRIRSIEEFNVPGRVPATSSDAGN
jgi:hypothetical protein